MGDYHARFCESLKGKFLWATRRSKSKNYKVPQTLKDCGTRKMSYKKYKLIKAIVILLLFSLLNSYLFYLLHI